MFNDEFNLFISCRFYMEPFELNMVHSIVQEEISQLISAALENSIRSIFSPQAQL